MIGAVRSALQIAAPEALLRKGNLRRTPVRVEILRLLSRAQRPVSVPYILSQIRVLDSVTAYRTLGAFARKRLVHRVRGEDRTWLYALSDATAAPQHQHPHFVCDECGEVECLAESRVPGTLNESLHIRGDYAVSWSEVVVHGLCPRCH